MLFIPPVEFRRLEQTFYIHHNQTLNNQTQLKELLDYPKTTFVTLWTHELSVFKMLALTLHKLRQRVCC